MTWQLGICLGTLGIVALLSFAFLPPLHPGQIWSFVWFAALGLFSLRLLPYRPLGSSTVWLIAVGIASFMLGTLAAKPVLGKPLERLKRTAVPSRVIVRAAAASWTPTAVMLASFLAQITRDFGLRSALVSSVEVRTAIQNGGTQPHDQVRLCGALRSGTRGRGRSRVGAGPCPSPLDGVRPGRGDGDIFLDRPLDRSHGSCDCADRIRAHVPVVANPARVAGRRERSHRRRPR